jgi:hypothetical protein
LEHYQQQLTGPEIPSEERQRPDVETRAGLKTDEEKMGQSRGERRETARESDRENRQSRPGEGHG